MSTLHDVAKQAGVAPITVSRVVNGSRYVTQGVRDRVESAIQNLGYVPNALARSLRSKRTGTLALVLTDITNPFFTTMARGVEDAASDAGFMVILCNTDESVIEEGRYLRMLLEKQVDGILLVPARSSQESIRWVRDHGTPLVVLDRRIDDAPVDVVRCDSDSAAHGLGRLLLSLGHRHMAVLTGPRDVSTSADRIAGFDRALGSWPDPTTCRIYEGHFSEPSGHAMTLDALAARPRPTALFAANNFIAVGALNAIREAGMSVPQDVALVGFDDLSAASTTFPFLTVVAQPAYQMGQTAMKLLFERLREAESGPPREVILPTDLIVRQSSGGAVDGTPA